jgi:hypothetical protein
MDEDKLELLVVKNKELKALRRTVQQTEDFKNLHGSVDAFVMVPQDGYIEIKIPTFLREQLEQDLYDYYAEQLHIAEEDFKEM